MEIKITCDISKISRKQLNKAKRTIIDTYKDCKNNDKLVITIYCYTPGKYRSLYYNSNLSVFETWPCGSTGILWLNEIPEKDYI